MGVKFVSYNKRSVIYIWDSLGPSPALALSHIAAQCIEFEKR